MTDHSAAHAAWIWRDGALVSWNDAHVHLTSHVVHYGSSVFEGIRCYDTSSGPAVFRLGDHIQRLLGSCRIYRMPIQHGRDELLAGTIAVIAANGLSDCYVRPIVLRTGQQLGFFPGGIPVETAIIAIPWGSMLGQDAAERGVDVCVSSWRRPAPATLPTGAKAGGNYLIAQLAKMEARENGYAEALMLDWFGYVAEGGAENLFVVRGDELLTPPASAGILAGITRDTVIRIARRLGWTVREELIPRELLFTADELFLTGTAVEVTPIRSIDRVLLRDGRPGPMTRVIQECYRATVRGETEEAPKWLTPVAPRGDR